MIGFLGLSLNFIGSILLIVVSFIKKKPKIEFVDERTGFGFIRYAEVGVKNGQAELKKPVNILGAEKELERREATRFGFAFLVAGFSLQLLEKLSVKIYIFEIPLVIIFLMGLMIIIEMRQKERKEWATKVQEEYGNFDLIENLLEFKSYCAKHKLIFAPAK